MNFFYSMSWESYITYITIKTWGLGIPYKPTLPENHSSPLKIGGSDDSLPFGSQKVYFQGPTCCSGKVFPCSMGITHQCYTFFQTCGWASFTSFLLPGFLPTTEQDLSPRLVEWAQGKSDWLPDKSIWASFAGVGNSPLHRVFLDQGSPSSL